MKKILIINGPNLNLLGIRKPEVYGSRTLAELSLELSRYGATHSCEIEHFQTNHEGEIMDKLHSTIPKADYVGCIVNAGALTHYSYAIRDAIEAISVPCIEVHLSEIASREPFRSVSVLKDVCQAQISGKGVDGYKEAIDILLTRNQRSDL